MTQDNSTRADRCQAALVAYSNEDLEMNLIDFLADAMHWADRYGSDFHIALAQACRHYIHELNDQQQDERRLS
jgi:hypothetical protein